MASSSAVHETSPRLRDLIYFDFDKTASILSQIEGGLLKEMVSSQELVDARERAHEANLQVYKPKLESSTSEKLSDISTRVLHHDLLVRVERMLFESGAAVDVNSTLGEEAPNEDLVRHAIEGETYLRVEGWVEFEDYKRLSAFCDHFPKLAEMVRKSLEFSVTQTPEYQTVKAALEQERDSYKALPGHTKPAAKQRIRALEEQLKAIEVAIQGVVEPEPWILSALQQYVAMFLPDRLVMRVMPFDVLPRIQTICSLKREALVDTDLDNLLFAFGAQPNVRLTVLGIITSAPPRDPVVRDFVTIQESEDGSDSGAADGSAQFETALRNVLRAMNGFEQFFRFSRYPGVTVYPLAVYRTLPLREDIDLG